MSRALESLSPEETIALAIHIERANETRLRSFADVFSGYDPEVAARFSQLANEEIEHERILKSWFEEHYGGEIPAIDETEVREVIESFDLSDPESLIFDSLDPRGVFELALRAELAAQGFYRRAAASASDPRLRSLYEELRGMEGDHVSWLETKLEEIRGE